jgi:hypothetical protein
MVVGPEFEITGVPARTEKLAADPSPTVGTAAFAVVLTRAPMAITNAMAIITTIALELFMQVAPFRAPTARACLSLCRMVDRVVVGVMTVRSLMTNRSSRSP